MAAKNIKQLKDKRVLVIGLGKSGRAVIKRIIPLAKSVTAIDSNPSLDIKSEIESLDRILALKLEVILDPGVNDNTGLLGDKEIVIVSPGVPGDIPVIKHADSLGLPVWSEIEFGWGLLSDIEKQNTIAVTGTNGKTTVVTLLQKILSGAGKNAVVCGNIGNPLTDTIGIETDHELIRVIEISSFQLERIHTFSPKIGIILNISSDHLDRHLSISEYADTKFRLFVNSKTGNWGIFNIDDRYISERLDEGWRYFSKEMNIVRYSLRKESNAETFYNDNSILYSISGKRGFISLYGLNLPGRHNISNIMSAVSAAKILDVEDTVIENIVRGFQTLEHRIEFVAEISGIKIFNDSKATNPDATVKALESFSDKITLILGGKDKGMDFSYMMPYLDKRVSNIILIGETKPKILKALGLYKKQNQKAAFCVYSCNSFEEAVKKGLSSAQSGEILLLSPACASFDMFADYNDRGRQFKKIIMDISNGKK